jgi:hypothetical protein
MAMPNRHSLFSALPAILFVSKFPYWWAYIIGFIYAFWSHTFVDNISNEHWERSLLENITAGIILGSLFIFSWVQSSIAWGWLPVLVMMIGALGQDIIDGTLEYIVRVPPIFPTHYGSSYYTEPWYSQERFWITMLMESVSSIAILVLAYMRV